MHKLHAVTLYIKLSHGGVQLVFRELCHISLIALSVPDFRSVGRSEHHNVLLKLCVVSECLRYQYSSLLVRLNLTRSGNEKSAKLISALAHRHSLDFLGENSPFFLGINKKTSVVSSCDHELLAYLLAKLIRKAHSSLYVHIVIICSRQHFNKQEIHL